MKTSDFDYDLPKELIAQDPLEDRSASRLMVLHRKSGTIEHRVFHDIVEYLRPGDCLVRNNTKVIPARLFGMREDTGATIELLLLKRRENDVWETLVKPGKKARTGAKLVFGDNHLTGEIIDVLEDGNRLIQFHYEGIFEEILDELGQMPPAAVYNPQTEGQKPLSDSIRKVRRLGGCPYGWSAFYRRIVPKD